MTGFPTLLVQIAFTTAYNDTTPVWVDVTGYTESVSTKTGRPSELSNAEPGTVTVALNNTDGRFDPDNASGPYAGYVRPLRRIRIGATANGTYYPMFTGFVDSFVKTWPNGADHSITTVTATDRFKLLARRFDTFNSRPDEFADVRITALLQHSGIGAADRIINAASLAARTVATYDYDGTNLLQELQDAAFADGGLLFMDGYGRIVFQTVKYRQIGGATRARTSQVRFGNDPISIPVESDLDPRVDDTLMANKVTVTDCNGEVQMAQDTALATTDGPLDLDLGGTLLLTADAQDRVADMLALRKNPTVRYNSVSVNLLTLSAVNQEKVLARELSDRLTLAVIPPGLASGTARDQWIEGVAHDVTVTGDASWKTTFLLSSAGDAVTVIP